jgi:hypothetical protein
MTLGQHRAVRGRGSARRCQVGNQVFFGVLALRGVHSIAETQSERWRKFAAEALAQSAATSDETIQWTLVQVAASYEWLVRRAERATPLSNDITGQERSADR